MAYAVLVLALVALCAVVGWFSYRHMRCCDKKEPFRIIKYNVKWRRDAFEDCKCDICKTYGPMLVTPCQHYFHVSCFESATKEMVCPRCTLPIQDRVKIYCFSCRENSFKVRLYRVQDIEEAIAEGKGLHYDLCPKEIRTDRKLVDSEEVMM
jgi:hypothetical protein